MAELKRNFSGGKMNKDMDERVLAPGQYRDANNVQVMTSDGSNTGSLQTLLGNTNVTEDTVYTFIDPTMSKVVGVKALPEKDKVYFMVYSGADVAAVPVGTPQKDYIVEYNTQKKTTDFVFVDIHTVKHSITTATHDSTKKFRLKGGDQSWAHGIRIGMTITGTFNDNSGGNITIASTWNYKVSKIRYWAGVWWIHHDGVNAVGSSVGDVITFTTPRVLKFNPHNVIHSIDITNDMMFWTDNQNEPRKIHLERSKRGTGGVGGPLIGRVKSFYHNTMPAGVMTNSTFNDTLNTGLFHTRLVKRAESTSTQLVLALNRQKDQPIWVTEDHITVIKKSPTNPLSLKMYTTRVNRTNSDNEENPVSGNTTNMDFYSGGDLLETGDTINISFQTDIDLRVGDVLLMSNEPGLSSSSFAADKAKVRVTVDTIPNPPGPGGPPNNITTGVFGCIVNSIDVTIGSDSESWTARLEQEKPMFEFKFPRFSYRWRYQDGEYSTFAPWSEIAFQPGDFDYLPKKGFNLGMSNRLRYLTLHNYFPEWGALPEDVVEVDLLYKETNKSTVYTVKTLKPNDGDPIWPDFQLNGGRNRGEFELTSELIHAVVPSNQLLRPWDNVPRLAKTQVMTGNRLVFGNYTQNYTIDDSLVLACGLSSRNIPDSVAEDEEIPRRSVKSLRTYQIGVVWSDKYGRETPVMVAKTGGSVSIDKKDCVKQNWLFGKIKETAERPPWAEFVSYYVKETSNEYYNIAMDRFYNAEDGNVWLSFPSAERNKIEADTYLYLKKAHDGNLPVVEKARYRVIAVENEAPLFIKAKKQSFGFETLAFINSGLPEEGRKYIIVNGTDFDSTFKSTVDPVRLDNLQARIGGISGSEILVSDLYDVVNISDSGSNKKIVFTKRLGAECAPISVLDPAMEMKLEIVQNKFEDKPEFDGRFFVKILKDLTLEKELLSTMTVRNDYGVIDTLNIGFGCGGHGMDENHWEHWKKRRGAYNTIGSKFFIDDIDTYEGWDGSTSNINSGGIFNHSGVGVIDISYCNFTHDDLESRSDWVRITDYFKNQGQLFRFKQDPAQVVFKVEGYRSRLYQNQNHGNHGAVPDSGSPAFKWYNGSWNGMGGTPMIGADNDSAWNWENDLSDTGWNNNRASFRISVDKQFGSSASHLMDNSTMASMSKPNALGEMVPIADGERYDGAVIGGTITTLKAVADTSNGQTQSNGNKTNVWNVGDFHNWYPITSNTGVYLNTANQLQRAKEKWHRLFEGGPSYNHSPLNPSNPAGINWPGVSESAGGSSQRYGCLHAEAFHAGNQNAMALSEIEFLEPIIIVDGDGGETFSSTNPAIWETEPKEDVGLDIYYEASAKIPLNPDHRQNELLIPIGSKVYKSNYTTYLGEVRSVNSVNNKPYLTDITLDIDLVSTLTHDSFLKVERPDKMVMVLFVNRSGGAASGQKVIRLTTGENAIDQTTGIEFSSERAPWHNPTLLAWSNCWAFGNGVESDRVRDDFNAPQLDNGVKASTTLATPYEEELRSSGMIFSGIFNSTSGVNDLNQFIQAEPITKDINPSYGTIQRMHARNTNTLVFCEDKVLNILTNKDALYNADGNSNVTSSNNVLGAPTPIPGDYGISTNPESLAVAPGAMYWCDPMRGKVLKLEGNSTIKILSDVGMKDYFNDTLINVSDIIGTYDEKKDDYNISIGKKVTPSQVFSTKTTLTYSEVVKGWTAFKSFEPEMGVSLNNEYYTFKNGQMWQHHVSESIDYTPTIVPPNNFYGVQYYPDVTLFLNDNPGSVKSFNTLNYEGTQSRITSHLTDLDYYNLGTKKGWYVDSLTTDLQEVGQLEFKSKEGKWFSAIKGIATTLDNLDEREFSVQGLGSATTSTTGTPVTQSKLTVSPGTQSSTGTSWDTSADSVDWNFTGTLTQTISSGTVYPTSYKDAILHNITFNQGGALVYSGLDLDAANFTATGGTATTSGTGNATVYTYTAASGWNADAGITHVEFTNIGTAGDPGNTVRARIHYSSFTAPSTAKNMFVDIDHGGATSSGGNIYRNACVKVHYNQTANNNNRTVTVAQTDITGITETNIDQFDPNGHAEKSNEHEATGGVLQGQTTKMAEYTITCASAEYLVPQTGGKGVKTQYHSHSSASPWQPYFSYTLTNTMHTSTNNTNKIKSCKVEVFYTPPVGVLGLDPDPVSGEGGWCTFMHCVELTWLARQMTQPTNTNHTLNGMGFASPSTNGSQSFLSLNSTNAGDVGVVIRQGNNYYTLTADGEGYTGAWGEGEQSVVVNTISIDSSLTRDVPVNHNTSNTLSTVTAYNVATTSSSPTVNLTLGASCPTQSNPTTATQQNLQSNLITVTAKTNTVRVPTQMNGFTGVPGPTETGDGNSNVLTKNVSITYTASGANTISIDRQPLDSDVSGGAQNAELVVGSAGGRTITISNQEAVGLTAGMTAAHYGSRRVSTSVVSLAHASQIGFNASDYAQIIVGETVTGGNTVAGTTVSSKAVVNGNNVITLSSAETSASPSGTSYIFSGMIVPGVTISSITASGSTNQNITLSTALLGTIAQYERIDFENGYVYSTNLTAVMVETSTSSGGTITTVQNKKCLITGTITVTDLPVTASNFAINPNFLTVS